MTPSQLASAEALNPTMVSRLASHLTERGLVERSQPDGDRRSYRLRATPSGCAVVARLRATRAQAIGMRLEALTMEERSALWAGLGALEALSHPITPRRPGGSR